MPRPKGSPNKLTAEIKERLVKHYNMKLWILLI